MSGRSLRTRWMPGFQRRTPVATPPTDDHAGFVTRAVIDAILGHVFAEAAGESPHLATVIVAGDLKRLGDQAAGLPITPWHAAVAAAATAPPRRRGIDVDLASIIYTSGSTGEPKGVMLTHRNMLTACASISEYLRIGEDEVILGVLPLAFDYGLYQMIMAFANGARLVLERSFSF